MAFAEDLAALKQELKEARIPVDDVLALAGVNRSSWTRWGTHHTPRFDRWESVKATARRLLDERQRQDAA